MSQPIKVGSIVKFPGDDRHWRTVSLHVERGFARLEHAADGVIRSKIVDLDTLMVVDPHEGFESRTAAEIIEEFRQNPWRS